MRESPTHATILPLLNANIASNIKAVISSAVHAVVVEAITSAVPSTFEKLSRPLLTVLQGRMAPMLESLRKRMEYQSIEACVGGRRR